MFCLLPDELVVDVASRVERAKDIARLGLTCQRFYEIIMADPGALVWRPIALAGIAARGLDGPWIDAVVRAKGWPWMAKASEPLGPTESGLGFKRVPLYNHQRDTRVIMFGETKGLVAHGYAVCITAPLHPAPRVADGGVSEVDDPSRRSPPPAVVWHGQWNIGMPHGRLAMTVHGVETYDGEWERGWRTTGTSTYADGSVYKGGRCGGRAHGVYVDAKGRTLTSAWSSTHRPSADRRPSDDGQSTLAIQACPSADRCPNGDVYYVQRIAGAQKRASVRLVCSPLCPDPEFRSCVIEDTAWVYRVVRRPERCYIRPIHPDPASPAFSVFYEYFTRGLLWLDDDDDGDRLAIIGAFENTRR